MALVKTYILAPNFTYKPSGPIQIGNIIADPFRPTKALHGSSITHEIFQTLSSLPSNLVPAIEVITERDHEVTRETGVNLRASVWATFLQSIRVSLSGGREVNAKQTYAVSELETRYLRDEPSQAEIARRIAEPEVQAAIHAGSLRFRRQPVYMITGVKIARGFSVHEELSKAHDGGVESGVPISETVGVGAGFSAGRKTALKSTFQGGNEDIVFAYQLHVIREKGKGAQRRGDTAVWQSDAALLHDGDVGGKDEIEISISLAGEGDIREAEEEDDVGEDLPLRVDEVDDRGELIHVVSAGLSR